MPREIIVLNKTWQPINILNLPQAINKLINNKAKIIDLKDGFLLKTWEEWKNIAPNYDEEVIVTPNRVFRFPKIIVANEYNYIYQSAPSFNKKHLFHRDNYTCAYCQSKSDLSIDHVVPRCQGGETSWTNCVLACFRCNSKKAGRTPEQAGMKLLTQPTVPSFNLKFKNYHENKNGLY
jgi:5-methylcytosine-specific restriction endonuclease McrA